MSHVVELFGLPGAGKTTVGRQLAATSARAGRPVAWRSNHDAGTRRRLVAALTHAVGHPATTGQVAAVIARSGQGSPTQAARRLLGWHATQAIILDAPADHTLLLDEGVLQCLWSIGLVGELDRVLACLGTIPWTGPDRVVVLDVPLDELVRRLDARTTSHSRVDRVDPRTRGGLLARGHHVMHRLVRWYRDVAPDAVVTAVDGADPVPAAMATTLLSPPLSPTTSRPATRPRSTP